jgi:hypothetical protein
MAHARTSTNSAILRIWETATGKLPDLAESLAWQTHQLKDSLESVSAIAFCRIAIQQFPLTSDSL